MAHAEGTAAADGRELFEHASLIDWKPEYGLGMPIIDIQHMGLVSSINSLHFAMAHNFGEDMLEPTIGMVKEYTRVHFMTEELILKKYDFPKAERHIELHNRLRESMLDVGQESIFTQDPMRFLNFLKEWLVKHILGEDRKYRDYFLEMAASKRSGGSPAGCGAP